MANFVATFRFKSDSTYQTRYDSFVEAMKDLVPVPWEETSSFYAFALDSTAERVCDHLYYRSDFDATKDIMVVIDISRCVKAAKGQLEYPATLDASLGF